MTVSASNIAARHARNHGVRPRLLLLVFALAFAVFAASALAGSHATEGSFVINGSINAGDPVVTNPAYTVERAQCGPPPNASFNQASGMFHYDRYRFQSLRGWWAGGQYTLNSTCAKVSLLVHSGTATAVGYTSAFNPNNTAAGARAGIGLEAGQAGDFAYLVCTSFDSCSTAPHTFDVVVYESIQDGGASYTLLVEGDGVIMAAGSPTATASLQSFRASSALKGVLVRWRTRSEHDALGFNLYRGDKKKVRLTRSMVRASGNGRGHTYSYIDRSARKGKGAPYYLEVVQRSGSRIMFGPARMAAR